MIYGKLVDNLVTNHMDGYEETKAPKGSSLAWNIPFIGTTQCGASTSMRCIGVPYKERSAAARTYICEKGQCEDSLPAAYTPFIGVRRGRKCLASGPRGEVRL